MAADTIFALSSGLPPAAIAIVRISGPRALNAAHALCGDKLPARRPVLRKLTAQNGDLLDRALVLMFPGPDTATGEDLVEFHLHGGRAVVRAVETALSACAGLRTAEAGEFTRRAFANGRIDLGQAEALSDLLSAETEWQRRAAVEMAGSSFGRQVETWRQELLGLSAAVEADLDFSDEDDVAASNDGRDRVADGAQRLGASLEAVLAKPAVERLKDGIRVVLAGPPNSGKSSLLNALVAREAAIVSDVAGTTRDVVEVPVSINGVPFLLSDTAGIRAETADAIEAIGIDRALAAAQRADIVLWLGPEGAGPPHPSLAEVESKTDIDHVQKQDPIARISAKSGEGVEALLDWLVDKARTLVPNPGDYALNMRQRAELKDAVDALRSAATERDLLLQAEHLRLARLAFDRLTGRAHTEDLLDHIFSGFCIGK